MSKDEALRTLGELSWAFSSYAYWRMRYFKKMLVLVMLFLITLSLVLWTDLSNAHRGDFPYVLNLILTAITVSASSGLILYVNWSYYRATRDHVMRRFTGTMSSLSREKVEEALAQSIEVVGLACTKTTVVAKPSAISWLMKALNQHATEYELPELGASVILNEYIDEHDMGYMVYLGPITDSNCARMVRLAKELNRALRGKSA